MKNFIVVFCCIFLSFQNLFTQSSFKDFQYFDPVPNAKLINKETNIIIRPGKRIKKDTLYKHGAMSLAGTASGAITFRLTASDDGNIMIMKPDKTFSPGETVTVNFGSEIKSIKGNSIKPFCYIFEIKSREVNQDPPAGLINELDRAEIDRLLLSTKQNSVNDFPQITVTYSNNPSNGYLFLSNLVFNTAIPNTPYLLILNNNAAPFYAHQMPASIFDFDLQPNGKMTYFDQYRGKFYEMDTNYSIIDSFYTGNNYLTDLHELRVLPNNHALLLSYDKEHVDMSQIVPGGDPNALFTGLILQEIDSYKNVVFQWRSWDHFLITDATHENLDSNLIDYVHGNAIEIENDGNLLLSSRHMDEITKINRTTGDMIWRLGGKHNEFT